MTILKTKDINRKQFEQINELWNNEYPLKLKDRFPLLLEGVTKHEHYLIENNEEQVLAWAVLFEQEEEVRFSIIIDSKQQKRGLGSTLISQLKRDKDVFYGWVIDHNDDLKNDGSYYQSPLAFYLKHDFTLLQDVRIDTEMIKAVKIKWSRKKQTTVQ